MQLKLKKLFEEIKLNEEDSKKGNGDSNNSNNTYRYDYRF